MYNGSKDWTIPTNIQDLIEGTIPSRYIPSFEYYPVIENKISDRVLKKIKGTVAAIIYLEKQKDEKLLREAVDTVVELIKEEHPEQLRMFSVWLNRMFQNALNEKELERIKELTEVKSMLTQIAEQIEARGVQQGVQKGMQKGMQQNARENALKMKEKGYSVEDITGLTVKEIQNL